MSGRWGSGLAALSLAGQLACAAPEPVAVGSPAPRFELPALSGGELGSEILKGRPVILNFWATWCRPCRKEFPVLAELDRDPRVEVVTIALDEGGESVVEPFVRRERLPYRVLLGNQRVFERFDGYGIPFTLVLDPQQIVVSIYRGPATLEQLSGDLDRILGAARDD